jgi:hypothetical protein
MAVSSESVTHSQQPDSEPGSRGQGRGRSHGPRSTWDRDPGIGAPQETRGRAAPGPPTAGTAGPRPRRPAGLLAQASSAEAPGMACAGCRCALRPTIPRAA